MPRFEPFPGLRYDPARVDLADVTAPPYDVIGDEERATLAARSPHNIVHVDLPVDDGSGADRYARAGRFLDEWLADGVLTIDAEPSFSLYAMEHPGPGGSTRRTTGVIGTVELSPPGEPDLLPHEHTTPKAKSDRLALLRACAVNTSPIWLLSLAEGLGALCEPDGEPDGQCTDAEGVVHRIWKITAPDRLAAIRDRMASAPAVIADGHHRYETALAYREERRAIDGPGPWDHTMAFAVELAEDQLTVGPIHRLITGLPDDVDLREAFEAHFHLEPADPAGATLEARMTATGALALIVAGGAWFLHPRSPATTGPDLDSERLDAALTDLPAHELTFQHGVDAIVKAVASGGAQAGVLLRPVSVAQIAATADRRDRMPPKSTYFWPKPRTGPVLRPLGARPTRDDH